MTTKRLLTNWINLLRIGTLLCVIAVSFILGQAYGKYGDDNNLIGFVLQQYTYTYGIHDKPPAQLTDMLMLYGSAKLIVYIAVVLNFIIMGLDYYRDPENHFITTIKKRIGTLKEG